MRISVLYNSAPVSVIARSPLPLYMPRYGRFTKSLQPALRCACVERRPVCVACALIALPMDSFTGMLERFDVRALSDTVTADWRRPQ